MWRQTRSTEWGAPDTHHSLWSPLRGLSWQPLLLRAGRTLAGAWQPRAPRPQGFWLRSALARALGTQLPVDGRDAFQAVPAADACRKGVGNDTRGHLWRGMG